LPGEWAKSHAIGGQHHIAPRICDDFDILSSEVRFTMSGSDFRLTESTHAVFICERGTVQFYFVAFDEDVGKRFLYTLEEAAKLGERIAKAGVWEEFPVGGIATSELRSFGERLRAYGVNGC
jgi:hypothetical protein